MPFNPTQIVVDPKKWLIAKSVAQILTGSQSEMDQENVIELFPNPVQNEITILNPSNQNYELQLFSILGIQLNDVFRSNSKTVKLDVSYLPPGVAICRIRSGIKINTFKVVKN